jgi:hypothetical protein
MLNNLDPRERIRPLLGGQKCIDDDRGALFDYLAQVLVIIVAPASKMNSGL